MEKQTTTAQQRFNNLELSAYLRLPDIKRLVHRISSAQQEAAFTSLAVVSLHPEEGRTFLVSLLAMAYASVLKRRVLILDTISQTREDSFHLSTVMKRKTQDDAPMSNPSNLPMQGASGVDLVTTRSLRGDSESHQTGVSPLQTAEFLMNPFLKSLAPSYDLILLDTCALDAVTGEHFDPLVLSRQVEKTIILVSEKSAQQEELIRLKSKLDANQIKPLGFIRNEFSPSKNGRKA